MGTFTVPVQIANLNDGPSIEVAALVDTGATYTTLPASVLTRLGVQPIERRFFRLADDRQIEYPVGQARLRLEGRELVVLVVFAHEDTEPLLGATTLEIFGLGVDPLEQQLIPLPARSR